MLWNIKPNSKVEKVGGKMEKYKLAIGARVRKIRNKRMRKKLKNKPSIISNHCIGGIISHDLGLKFLSPTVNLKILPDDFIKFVENLKEYLDAEFVEEKSDLPYPVGKLKDITVYFVHYKTFQQAVEKWNERKQRVDFNNIRVMMTARDGAKYETLKRFNELPYKKVMFDDVAHPEFDTAIYAHRRNGKPLGNVYISDIITITGKRAFEINGFDIVEFLN